MQRWNIADESSDSSLTSASALPQTDLELQCEEQLSSLPTKSISGQHRRRGGRQREGSPPRGLTEKERRNWERERRKKDVHNKSNLTWFLKSVHSWIRKGRIRSYGWIRIGGSRGADPDGADPKLGVDQDGADPKLRADPDGADPKLGADPNWVDPEGRIRIGRFRRGADLKVANLEGAPEEIRKGGSGWRIGWIQRNQLTRQVNLKKNKPEPGYW